MSLGDSGTGGGGSGMNGNGVGGCGSGGGGSSLHLHHKKLRRKRKELDALVPEEKIRRKASSSVSRHDLLRHSDSDDVEYSSGGSSASDSGLFFGRGGLLGCLPGVCALLVLLTTAVGVAASLRLLMTTRKDLDALQLRLNAVEASGSELPSKFHESHVRLQQLEKNHTSLWATLSSVSVDVKDLSEKMKTLETSLKALEDRLSGTPKLSSLPKTVADVEASVATFGSSLQDVQSTLKTLKEGHDSLQKNLENTRTSMNSIKSDVNQLKNDTHLPPSQGREGKSDVGGEESVATAVISLRSDVADISSSLAIMNASVTSSFKQRQSGADKVQSIEASLNESIKNLSSKVVHLQETCDKLESENWQQQIANLSSDFSHFRQLLDEHSKKIRNLNESIAVVKGVEKKLEGSQLQMASGVSELKQQLQKLEKSFESLLASSTTPSSVQSKNNKRKRRGTSGFFEDLLEIQPSGRLVT